MNNLKELCPFPKVDGTNLMLKLHYFTISLFFGEMNTKSPRFKQTFDFILPVGGHSFPLFYSTIIPPSPDSNIHQGIPTSAVTTCIFDQHLFPFPIQLQGNNFLGEGSPGSFYGVLFG